MTRYRITQRRNAWTVEQFDPTFGKWFELGPQYENASAELAGRTVDALEAMESTARADQWSQQELERLDRCQVPLLLNKIDLT